MEHRTGGIVSITAGNASSGGMRRHASSKSVTHANHPLQNRYGILVANSLSVRETRPQSVPNQTQKHCSSSSPLVQKPTWPNAPAVVVMDAAAGFFGESLHITRLRLRAQNNTTYPQKRKHRRPVAVVNVAGRQRQLLALPRRVPD